MSNELPIPLIVAEQKAVDIINKYGIDSPEHIRIEDIAYCLGATIVDGSLKGAAARLVRFGNKATIRISEDERYPARRRFSIAHELGHFVLNHGQSLEIVCSEQNMLDWHQGSGQESQANTFAGELLLPRILFEKRCDVREVNLSVIRGLTEEFQTSLTATAIRFIRFCPEICAVIFSQESKIKWFYKSKDWWPFISLGQKLDNRTLAFDFFQGKELPDEPVEVPSDAWVNNARGLDEIVEHSFGSQRLGFVLSVLWIRS